MSASRRSEQDIFNVVYIYVCVCVFWFLIIAFIISAATVLSFGWYPNSDNTESGHGLQRTCNLKFDPNCYGCCEK